LVSHRALAQSVYHVLSQHRLLGVWSADCAQPASIDNPKVTFSAPPEGYGRLVRDQGPGQEPATSVIRKAYDLTTDRILIHGYRPGDNSPTDLVFNESGDKLRIIWERENDTGRVLIDDGLVAATGRRTGWLARCP
jgi:hypothetical protein